MIIPYVNDLASLAALEEIDLINEVLYLYHQSKGSLSEDLITYSSQRLVTDLLMRNHIVEEDYDVLSSTIYEVLEVLANYFGRLLGHLNTQREMVAFKFYEGDLIITYQDLLDETHSPPGLGMATYPGRAGELLQRNG
jgi:hypothetical protein